MRELAASFVSEKQCISVDPFLLFTHVLYGSVSIFEKKTE